MLRTRHCAPPYGYRGRWRQTRSQAIRQLADRRHGGIGRRQGRSLDRPACGKNRRGRRRGAQRRASAAADRRDELTTHVQGKVSEALDDLNESLLKDLRAALREDAKPITAMLARFADGPRRTVRSPGRLRRSIAWRPSNGSSPDTERWKSEIVRAVETAEKEQFNHHSVRASRLP